VTREIPLSRGLVALVDDEDFDWLSQWKWFLNTHGYAARKTSGAGGVRRRDIFMHREILCPHQGLLTDHKNGDRLDNRRANLRMCSRRQNNCNRAPSSGREYLGVSFDRTRGLWMARVSVNRRQTTFGRFATAEDAARAYDHHARILHGEFARLNFPDEKAA
jgi:hypothetical protein